MIYRTPPHLLLWDTWMCKDGDAYHLFTLTRPEGLRYRDRVCHAVSRDLLRWEDWEDIVLEEKENKDAWDAGVILTGSDWELFPPLASPGRYVDMEVPQHFELS